MQWPKNTARIRIFSFVLALTAALAGGAWGEDTPLTTASSGGTTSGSMVQGRFGDAKALNQNLNAPMTNSSTQMYTLDGSKSFSAALGIPSSNKFLEIIIQPSGTGDLSNVIIAQDLNADNTFEHTFTIGMPVSGVCSNGFISCSPGTWNDCRAYGWVSDDTGKLQVGSAPITSLAGCFCINSSCGSNLAWTNSGVVLQALGGGAVGSIRVKDATTTITNVAMDPIMITYYGQLTRQAGSAAASVPATASMPGPQTQQSYYGNWSTLDAERDNISLTQASDPGSLYYQMTNSESSTNAQVRACNVTRTGTINSTVESSDYNTGYTYLHTEHYIDMQIWQSTDKQTYKLQLMDHWDGRDHESALGQVWHEPMDTNKWHTINTFTLPLNDSTSASKLSKALFGMKIVSGAGCTPGSVYTIDGVTQGFNRRVNVGGYCSGAGMQYPYLQWSYLFEFQKDVYVESIADGCSTIASDPTCRLRGETVDGVPTTRNYTSTGLHQLPSCRTLSGNVQSFDICRQWWQKQREYVCDVAPPSFDLTRYKTIKDTTATSGTSFNFTDYRQSADGSWSSVAMNGTLPEGQTYETCMPTCKIKKPIRYTEVTLTGTVGDNMMDSNSFETRYLPCSPDNVCPVEPGDQIVTACGCIDEFAQAATIMQSMRLSGADSICSSGTAKPP